MPLLRSYIFHSSFNVHKYFHTFLTLTEKNYNLNKSIEPWKLDSNLCGSLEIWCLIPTDTHFGSTGKALPDYVSHDYNTLLYHLEGVQNYSVSSFLWCITFFLLLPCLQCSYCITFLNLNLFSRSSIQLSNVIVLRIYNQIIVYQALLFSASSFASAFCDLKRIFLLWSYKLHHSMQSCHTEQDQFHLVKEVYVSGCSDILHNRTKWNKIKSNQIKWNWIGIPLVSEEVEFWNVCPESNPHCIYSH